MTDEQKLQPSAPVTGPQLSASLPDFVSPAPAIEREEKLLLYDAYGYETTDEREARSREPLASFATRFHLPVDAVREVNKDALTEDGWLLPDVRSLKLPKTTP